MKKKKWNKRRVNRCSSGKMSRRPLVLKFSTKARKINENDLDGKSNKNILWENRCRRVEEQQMFTKMSNLKKIRRKYGRKKACIVSMTDEQSETRRKRKRQRYKNRERKAFHVKVHLNCCFLFSALENVLVTHHFSIYLFIRCGVLLFSFYLYL